MSQSCSPKQHILAERPAATSPSLSALVADRTPDVGHVAFATSPDARILQLQSLEQLGLLRVGHVAISSEK